MCDDFNISRVQVHSEYMKAYDFEVFDGLYFHNLFVTYRPVMYGVIVIYLLAIYFGQKWMEKRPPFKLNTALFFWNAGLALFSIAATLRSYKEALFLMSTPGGTYEAVCSGEFTNYAVMFWGMLFVISKFVELGDTAFIILRKKKLILLHWFHHVATLMACWIASEYVPAAGRFFFINTFVHSFMYSYYALKALKVKIPRRVSMTLTIIQLVQFIFGGYLLFHVLIALVNGRPCRLNWRLAYLGAFIVTTFLSLFANFFVKTYLQRDKKKAL